MKTTLKLYIETAFKTSLFLAFLSFARADAPQPVGPLNFGGGLNVATLPSDIQDSESPDLCNCVNDLQGGAFKRNGSERYISQAHSTAPVSGLYRGIASTGAVVSKAVLAVIGDKIVRSTSTDNPYWVTLATGLNPNQTWSFVTMNNKILATGDGLTDSVKQIDLISRSSATDLFFGDGSSSTVVYDGKYHLMAKNYYLLANLKDRTLTGSTTYYPSRVAYSLLAKPSSMTATRFIDFRTDDGEELTGLGTLFDRVHFFKPSSIAELDFDILSPGSFTLAEVVNGFGVLAPRTLANTGQFYVFLAKDGIRLWDGGRRSRLTVAEESRIISGKIKPIIDDIIKAGTYRSAVGIYYPKNEWYVFAYEDPKKFPRGRNNSVLVYDFQTDQWFPFCNWLVGSLAVMDGAGDNGDLLYGDSSDGYVYLADVEVRADDARKEISISPMDRKEDWISSTQDLSNVKEGTASLKISVNATTTQSSMTYVAVINAGEWYDKTKITKDDKLAFKVFPTTLSGITSLRVDLEVNDVAEAFDTNFTSVTITSASFSNGWTTFEIALSSFPMRPDWADLTTENVPFANTLTFYGVRFVLNGTTNASVAVDDLRIVEATDNPLRAYRFTKLFNFGTMTNKTVGQVLLTMEKSAEANLYLDTYNDFGSKINTREFERTIPKEIIVLGYVSTASVSILDSVDFSTERSSAAKEANWLAFNGTADKDYVYTYDRQNERILKFDRDDLSVFASTYGAFGSGTTNFNLVHQMAMDDKSLVVVDMNNQRIKQHAKASLAFLQMTGSLGTKTTSFHQPSAIKVDENNVFVADEGNYRLLKLSKSTFGYVSHVNVDYNTIGDSSLELDEAHLYLAYNKISETSINNQDIVLEKRDKGNLSLLNRVVVRPDGVVTVSTYTLMGDIALLGKYIYISFTDDGGFNPGSRYYLQKRLKDDFSLVRELVSTTPFYSVIGDGLAYKPQTKTYKMDLKTEQGKYFQIKYYDDSLDNNWKLFNQTFLVQPTPQGY